MVTGRVYVVEDHDAVRILTTDLLLAAGYEALSYASGEDFLSQADLATAACVILDIRLPGIDGMEVLRRLKPFASTVAVIILTGNAEVRLAVAALKEGACDFLEKPFDLDNLLAAVSKALSTIPKRSAWEGARLLVEALTAREHEVLLGLVGGRSNHEMAADLGPLSSQTKCNT